MPRFLSLLLLLFWSLPAQPGAAQAPADRPPSLELARVDQAIEEVTAMKAQLAALEQRLDALLRNLSEQRGALQRSPPAFNALKTIDSTADARPVKPTVRCAALTNAGKRCTRPAADGSKYCKQHQLGH